MKKAIMIIAAAALIVGGIFAADQKKAAAPATQAAPAAPAATAAPADAQTVTGVIVKVVPANKTKKTAESIVVRGADKTETTLSITAATTLTNSKGKAIRFAALRKGMKVTIAWKQGDAGNEAVSIQTVK